MYTTKQNGPEIMSKILCFTIVIVLHDCVNAVDNPCPKFTVNYKDSCYVFLGEDVTRHFYNDIWVKVKRVADHVYCMEDPCDWDDPSCLTTRPCPKPVPGRTRGVHSHDMDGCVWDKQQALDVCRQMHEVRLPSGPSLSNLSRYSDFWHLPIIETDEEDDWLKQVLNKGPWFNQKMGTHFWIDLVKLGDRYVWESTGELADWIHLPNGIDRWWEKSNVLRKARPGETKMCYEYHTDYGDTTKPEQLPTDRKLHMPIEVYGWHPRACEGAYEEASELDTPLDFSEEEEKTAKKYWLYPVKMQIAYLASPLRGVALHHLRKWCGGYSMEEGWCMIPEDRWNHRREPGLVYLFTNWESAECHNKPISFLRDKFRMLLAPTGVVCEMSIECINNPPSPKCRAAD